MRVLIVCSGNVFQPFIEEQVDELAKHYRPFIIEQVNSISRQMIEIDYFYIMGKGFVGYWQNRKKLILKISEYKPNLIHAHYGLSGLFANMQRSVPVITTYHGSDINNNNIFRLSLVSTIFSVFNIFVSKKIATKANSKKKYCVIPCGTNINLFKPVNKKEARTLLNLPETDKIVLFAGSFHNYVKNYPLAKSAISKLYDVRLIELNGYTREQVSLYISACDLVLMTSFSEGSPQVIKEAMACNCPIVSTDVGDVVDVFGDTEGCYICSFDPIDVALKIQFALKFAGTKGRTIGRERIIELKLDSENIAKRIIEVYEKILIE